MCKISTLEYGHAQHINAFAVHKRVKKFLDLLDNGNGKFKASVLDAMLFLHQVWADVSLTVFVTVAFM